MKKTFSLIIILTLVLGILSGCAGPAGNSYALKIGDKEISPMQYKASAISIKNQFITENGLEETNDLWTQYVDTSYSSTVQQYLDAMVQTYLITYNLYAIHFDELGLSLDADTEAKIEADLQTYVERYGSREKLDEALKEQGFSYDEYRNQFYNEAKKSAVITYYFGPDSTVNPTSREEMKKYYDEYYTKVKHIFLSTKDDQENDLTIPGKKEVGDKAEKVLKRAQSGENFEKLIEEFGEDPGMISNPDGYIFSQDDTSYTKAFHNAAFDMKFGEIRLVQSNLGYHIMKRYEFVTAEIQDPEIELNLIENMMSSEIADILEDLKERIGVEYNNSVLDTLTVSKLPKSTDTTKTEQPETNKTEQK